MGMTCKPGNSVLVSQEETARSACPFASMAWPSALPTGCRSKEMCGCC